MMAPWPALAQGASKAVWQGVVTSVFDGDSLRVRRDGERMTRRVRIDGIDAPEICQADGMAARDALRAQLLGKRVTVTVHAHDTYGRAIAVVHRQADGLEAGRWMAARGWAWSPGFGWRAGRYATEQYHAQQQGIGVFARDDAQTPASFRREHGPCEAAPHR